MMNYRASGDRQQATGIRRQATGDKKAQGQPSLKLRLTKHGAGGREQGAWGMGPAFAKATADEAWSGEHRLKPDS
jgi:hypothetical protein